MGSMEDILKMIPGMGGKLNGLQIDEKAMGHTKAIIQAMTPKERMVSSAPLSTSLIPSTEESASAIVCAVSLSTARSFA